MYSNTIVLCKVFDEGKIKNSQQGYLTAVLDPY